MDDNDRPRRRSTEGDLGTASLLASESLERYSLDELGARIELLETEIARIREHRRKSADHMSAAEALFRPRSA
ncbi:hypothetical protein WSK_0250 [Novosphingobium sp. Rr 2-17]|uniref:DUF1192 domain-containing protein n=1 Tax=Novosphingobium sp. Rr 2-17 TaxID=555793 RepID=UPI0002698811|nr:DUF1192 domain-containing protein [Novosphingobium sp. Rr 2-17]EIZ81098.1 hypothetical protein WSK_0250 [Novosphingobium sp. Rr 2-17]